MYKRSLVQKIQSRRRVWGSINIYVLNLFFCAFLGTHYHSLIDTSPGLEGLQPIPLWFCPS